MLSVNPGTRVIIRLANGKCMWEMEAVCDIAMYSHKNADLESITNELQWFKDVAI